MRLDLQYFALLMHQSKPGGKPQGQKDLYSAQTVQMSVSLGSDGSSNGIGAFGSLLFMSGKAPAL